MYYVKEIRFDYETGKSVSKVLLSTEELSIALGVCKQFSESALHVFRVPLDISYRVLNGHNIVARFDCLISSQSK